MRLGKTFTLVRVLLVLSILVGFIILAFDGLLWFDNPKTHHATALIAFTIIQLFIVGLLFFKPRVGFRLTFYWSMLYLIILLLNPLTAPAIGISVEAFALYLLGITPITSTPQFACPFLCPPFIITYDLLIIIQIIIIATFLRTRGRGLR
ncbi:hypothetical protein HRbin02_00901 [Candidatus Calditenuaceae archaeon HR02]|nr:hypothetical protein HRbin02_00901 [Candidatus Calditenuaceae archaeon HR02]